MFDIKQARYASLSLSLLIFILWVYKEIWRDKAHTLSFYTSSIIFFFCQIHSIFPLLFIFRFVSISDYLYFSFNSYLITPFVMEDREIRYGAFIYLNLLIYFSVKCLTFLFYTFILKKIIQKMKRCIKLFIYLDLFIYQSI